MLGKGRCGVPFSLLKVFARESKALAELPAMIQRLAEETYSGILAKEQEEQRKTYQEQLKEAAKLLKVEGYCRIDAFVKIFPGHKVEVLFIEINSLPGMTPATAIFHQCALSNYKPYQFIDKILKFGEERMKKKRS